MTAAPPSPGGGPSPGPVDPAALLGALRADAGSVVDGAEAGSARGAPDCAGLAPARAHAVLAAWTGARLHAGQAGLLRAPEPDLALLVGDWCFAHALQALAHAEDLDAIATLADAIGACAVALTEAPAGTDALTAVWARACESMRAR